MGHVTKKTLVKSLFKIHIKKVYDKSTVFGLKALLQEAVSNWPLIPQLSISIRWFES